MRYIFELLKFILTKIDFFHKNNFHNLGAILSFDEKGTL